MSRRRMTRISERNKISHHHRHQTILHQYIVTLCMSEYDLNFRFHHTIGRWTLFGLCTKSLDIIILSFGMKFWPSPIYLMSCQIKLHTKWTERIKFHQFKFSSGNVYITKPFPNMFLANRTKTSSENEFFSILSQVTWMLSSSLPCAFWWQRQRCQQ